MKGQKRNIQMNIKEVVGSRLDRQREYMNMGLRGGEGSQGVEIVVVGRIFKQ